jgi:hypothetical protein
METPRVRGIGLARICVLTSAIVLSASCAHMQVPSRSLVIPSRELQFTSRGGVAIGARPIVGRDRYWDLFDENLPEFGIGAIWVDMQNDSETALDMGKARWVLAENQAEMRELDPNGFFDRYYHLRQIRMVSTEADRKSKLALENIRFQAARIPSRTAKQGFLFFPIQPTNSEDWIHNGILHVSRVRDGQGAVLSFQVSLAHANP